MGSSSCRCGWRTVLGDKRAIRAQPPGYVLDLRDGTDVLLVRQLMRLARPADAPAEQARHLAAALSLWRGQPLADVEGGTWLEGQADRLKMLHADVARALYDARLAAGEIAWEAAIQRPSGVIPGAFLRFLRDQTAVLECFSHALAPSDVR